VQVLFFKKFINILVLLKKGIDVNRYDVGVVLSVVIGAITFFHSASIVFQVINKVITFPSRTFFGLLGFGLALITGYLIADKGHKIVGGLLILTSSLTELLIFFFYEPSLATPWSLFSLIGGILILSSNIPKLS